MSEFMIDYRHEFPVSRDWAFFDHASVGPLSGRARTKIFAWANDMAENGGVNEGDWWREMEADRALAARLLGAQTEEIAFVPNTSAGLALVAEGFPWRRGDNVVVAAGEYPANVYPWLHLQDRGVEVHYVPVRNHRLELEDFAAAIDGKTRMLSLSHVQYATGFRSDLAAVGRLCRERGVDFCVDAIQGLGVFPIDVERMGVDYLAADGHKWLVGPEGAGIFFVRKEKTASLRPTAVGWKSVQNMFDYSRIDFRLKQDASRFEPGTFNTPGILGLGASLSLLLEVGVETICERVREVTDHLVDRLLEVGAEIASPRERGEWSGIVSFSLPARDPQEFVRRCRDRRVALSCRDGRIRASPHFYNTREDVDRLMNVVKGL